MSVNSVVRALPKTCNYYENLKRFRHFTKANAQRITYFYDNKLQFEIVIVMQVTFKQKTESEAHFPLTHESKFKPKVNYLHFIIKTAS